MRRQAILFGVRFVVIIGLLSILLQLETVNRLAVIPYTGVIAHVSAAVSRLIGMSATVDGTVILSDGGFAANILMGCNGVYVTAIVVSAVLAYPATWRERLIGLALALPGVQVVNIIRIVSLYYIGVNHPSLFEQFHYYVWQTGVIMASMAIWIFWAEVLVARPAPAPAGAPARGRGSRPPGGPAAARR